jgi:GNAT superfamily N-acetyltransferase
MDAPSKFWSEFFGCDETLLWSRPCHVVQHSESLASYSGILGIFCGSAGTVSFPKDCGDELRRLLPESDLSAARFADAYESAGLAVVGPAYLGYARQVPAVLHVARVLTSDDRDSIADLQANCTATEWEHGGSEIGVTPMFGAFVGDELVAVAGYETWGGALAHISVVVGPAHRSKGYGRSVVSTCAAAALDAGLLAQYRTLRSNEASMRVADALGFKPFADTVAVRIPK